MSKIALDLKQFKHVNTDGDITTLKHKAGHVLTIAHDALSPEARTQLQALSGIPKETATPDQRQEAQTKMAKGGKVAKYCMYCGGMAHGGECKVSSPSNPKLSESKKTPKMYADPDEPVSQEDSAPTQDETTQADAINPNPVVIPDPAGVTGYKMHVPTDQEVEDQKVARLKEDVAAETSKQKEKSDLKAVIDKPASPAPAEPNTPEEPNSSRAASTDVAPPATGATATPSTMTPPAPTTGSQGAVAPMTFPEHKQLAKDELSNEAAAWEHDLENGHITPKTYADLFADKTTLQKVGIGFGMLLSGLGSGMAHQSNAVMDMMDKTIQNDLNAQAKSKENARNFLKLNQEQLLTESQSRNLDVEAKAKAWALSQSQTLLSTFHNLKVRAENMPEATPQQQMLKQQAQQQLGIIYSKIGDRITDINDQAAGAIAFNKMLFGVGQGATDAQQFVGQMNTLKQFGPQGEARAKELEGKTLPGYYGQQAYRPIEKNDLDAAQKYEKLGKLYTAAKKYIHDVGPFGTVIPGKMKGLGQSLQDEIVLTSGELNGLVRFTPAEEKLYIHEAPDLTGTHFSGQDMAKIDRMMSSLGSRQDSLANSYGLTPNRPGSKTPTRASTFKPR